MIIRNMKQDYYYLCNNQYDPAFDKISGLYRYPWIGNKFVERDYRILILGDSHYAVDEKGNESEEEVKRFKKDKNSTREVINCVINDVCSNESIWTMFRNLIATFTSITPDEVKDLWSKVAFYNFIQEPMKKRDQEPSSEEEQDGWRCFCEVIDIIAPNFCIFIGKRRSQEINAIKNLCTKFTLNEDQDICNRVHPLYGEIETKKGILTQYLIIKHTSSYYSPDAWNRYFRIKRPEIIAQLDSHFIKD